MGQNLHCIGYSLTSLKTIGSIFLLPLKVDGEHLHSKDIAYTQSFSFIKEAHLVSMTDKHAEKVHNSKKCKNNKYYLKNNTNH